MIGHRESVTCMAIDGNLLFSGDDAGIIYQWELTLHTLSGEVGTEETRHTERK